MSWFVSDEPVAVELEACHCPGTPHSTDTIWLRSATPVELGIAASGVIRQAFIGQDVSTLDEDIGRLYLQYGVVRWTAVDEQGEPVPVTRELIARLDWKVARPVANKAAELYSEVITRPLVEAMSKSSPNGRTAPSTSATPKSSSARRKR